MHLIKVIIQSDRFPTAEHYPFTLPVLRQTPGLEFSTPVTLLVGENGAGKSTFLRALAEASGVMIWQDTSHLRFERNPYRTRLRDYLSVQWAGERVPGSYFGSDIFEFFTEILDEWAESDPGQLKYFGGTSLRSMSHGQSMLTFFRNRYKIPGVYFLDEPETALSPRSQLALLELLGQADPEGGAQYIVATHSPILLACPGARIFSFDRVPVAPIAYEETEHYRVFSDFLLAQRERLNTSTAGKAIAS